MYILLSLKPARIFQWDVVDRPTSPDSGDQNVLKTFEMAIRHNRLTTRMEIEFSVAGFIFTYVQKCFCPLMGAGAIAPPHGSAAGLLAGVVWNATHWLDAVCLRWQEHATLTYS